jgi:branched-subunit amino acid aminotransferase/4-amino-4-deoxychorismate lyase
MTTPWAYSNGRLIPAAELSVSVADAGFVLGATVAEQLRTFGGRLFRLEQHLERLARSLEIVGVDPGCPLADLASAAEELAARNQRLVEPGDDLGMAIFVTPGGYAPLAGRGAVAAGPSIGIHTWPLAFGLWAARYERGESLVTPVVRQTPADCWPPELKCRSRMHYYLADRAARAQEPGARALLLDHRGSVCETAAANLVAVCRNQGLVTPPNTQVLRGISLQALHELATAAGLDWHERELRPEDLAHADELLLTSTHSCVLPATRLNGHPIGDGRPGPVYRQLLAAWSALVGLDIPAQARHFASQPEA